MDFQDDAIVWAVDPIIWRMDRSWNPKNQLARSGLITINYLWQLVINIMFIPTTQEEVTSRGWDSLDVILVSGKAKHLHLVAHPRNSPETWGITILSGSIFLQLHYKVY